MSLVTKTIDSRILDKEMKLAVYRPAVNDNSALPVLYFLHGRTEPTFKIIYLRGITTETTSSLTWKPIFDFIACEQLPVSRHVDMVFTEETV